MKSYRIQPGDTLYRIARKHNLSVRDLTEKNPHVNPYLLIPQQKIHIPKQSKKYKNFTYNISFLYPASWFKIDDTRYEDKNGFFQISAIASAGALEDVCQSEVFHKLKPYGSQPKIRQFKYLGQNACLIFPDKDQAPEMKSQAAFIIKYPMPIAIENEKYNYFVLWADSCNILAMIESLKFLWI